MILWTVGRIQPNTEFVPSRHLNEEGFVQVDEFFRVPGTANVLAIGDVAATDPLRSSARNMGHMALAANVRRLLAGRPATKTFSPPGARWGSIFGLESDGLRIFSPGGTMTRVPVSVCKRLLFPWIVNRGIYGGIDSGDVR